MKKCTLVLSLLFLAVALSFVLIAWFVAWSVHQENLDRDRRFWGAGADDPFDPTTAIVPSRMPEDTKTFYVLAGPFAVAGVSLLVLRRISVPRRKSTETADQVL